MKAPDNVFRLCLHAAATALASVGEEGKPGLQIWIGNGGRQVFQRGKSSRARVAYSEDTTSIRIRTRRCIEHDDRVGQREPAG